MCMKDAKYLGFLDGYKIVEYERMETNFDNREQTSECLCG